MARRLAAILVADIVGYSRLMEVDEAGTVAALRERRSTVLDAVVRAHSGRIVKLMGDGVLIEFASALNAVKAAIELQEGMAAANTGLPEDRHLILRIGINLGDVIGTGRDIFGDSVNIAARLEALAEPGGICISAKIHEEVVRRIDCGFEDIGAQSVKNISRPVHAYRLRPAGFVTTSAPGPDLALPDKPSIAVLPFDNMSADAEQAYFADGIVEDIITELSRAKWLFVIARNSSFAYKGRAVDLKQVGRELGVRYILEGSVRRAGARLRITGQLIDAGTGAHLWADRFDGVEADVFDLQDRVTQSVVGAIAPRLELAEIDRVRRKHPASLDAYEHYLRGMAGFHDFSRESNASALRHFIKAFELDPGFAAAYGMAARCYAQRTGFGWITDRQRESDEAQRLARKATSVGKDDAIALAAAGFSLIMFKQVLDGDAFLDQALEINPNLAWAWHMSALAKAVLGQSDVAIAHATRAMRLSPQDPQIFAMQAMLGLGHFVAGNFEAALSPARAASRKQSNFLPASCLEAACAALTGRQAEAEQAMARVRIIDPDLRVANLKDWLHFHRAEDAAQWAEGLRRAGLPD